MDFPQKSWSRPPRNLVLYTRIHERTNAWTQDHNGGIPDQPNWWTRVYADCGMNKKASFIITSVFFFTQPQSSIPNRNGNLCDVEYPRCSAGIFILHVDMNATRLDWNIPYEDIWAWNIPCDLSYIHLRCTISRTWWSHERGSFWQLIHFLILQRSILVLKTAWLIIGNQQLLLTHLRCLSRSIHLIFNSNHSIKLEVKFWSK